MHIIIMLGGIALAVYGIWVARNPEDAWDAAEGKKYRNVEPSDWSVNSLLIRGLITIMAGLFITGAALYFMFNNIEIFG